jgi:hypothetical protein
LKPVLTDLTGAPCHSTKCEVTMPRRAQRRICSCALDLKEAKALLDELAA